MDTKPNTEIETQAVTPKKNIISRVKGHADKMFSTLAGVAMLVIVQTATVRPASAEINATTFQPIVNLIDAVIPLFDSILDLVIAVFPLVIGMAFLGGLAYLINKIFHAVLSFNMGGKK